MVFLGTYLIFINTLYCIFSGIGMNIKYLLKLNVISTTTLATKITMKKITKDRLANENFAKLPRIIHT